MSVIELMKISHDKGILQQILNAYRRFNVGPDITGTVSHTLQHTHRTDRTWQLLLQTSDFWRYL